jgi:hypothetical protein
MSDHANRVIALVALAAFAVLWPHVGAKNCLPDGQLQIEYIWR